MPTDSPGTDPYRIYRAASLGDAIRHYPTDAGLTQAQLAEATGLQRTYLSELEGGKDTEQLTRIIRVLHHLGVRMTLSHRGLVAGLTQGNHPPFRRPTYRVR